MEGKMCPHVPKKSKVGSLRLKNYVKVGGTLGKTLIKKNIFIPIFLLFFPRYLPWIFPDRTGRQGHAETLHFPIHFILFLKIKYSFTT